jgi:hypothetical protein
MPNSGLDRAGVENAARSGTKRRGATERRPNGLGQPGKWEWKIESRFGCQKTEAYVSSSS